MDGKGITSFLKSSLGLLSADVFAHPVWLHAKITDAREAGLLAGELQNEAALLADQEDWLDACRVCLASAYLQNLAGSPKTALECLLTADQMARRNGLASVVIWADWGASAVCAQAGDYNQSVKHLQRLQQDLYRENQWVLADVIELVRQSLVDWVSGVRSPLSDGQDRTGLLIEQMLRWGRPEAISPDAAPEAAPTPPRQGFWVRLLRFLRGELRLELVEVNGHNPSHQNNGNATLAEPAQHTALAMPLLPAVQQIDPPLPELQEESAIPVPWPVYGQPLTPPPPEMIQPPASAEPAAPVTPFVLAQQAPLMQPDPRIEAVAAPLQDGTPEAGEEAAASQAAGLAVTLAEPAKPRGPRTRTRPPAGAQAAARPVLLKACLLGSFRLELAGSVIDTWPSGRSKAVFAYLLAHHAHPVPRDVLMETFWPETTLDSARNNLNVAVYSLRQTLKPLTTSPVILLRETSYQVNPDLRLWVDVTVFEQAAREGRQCENAGAIENSARAYEAAIGLYQGDLLAETPFEGWTTLERERLRVLYLETLDHLSTIHFNQGRYAACIELCQRLLSQDTCREDAHCRLMRCYARQGQPHLAMRQFMACVEALRDELDVPPSPAIVQLYEQVRRQELV